MFYFEILTREKIKAGKFILDKLVEEGWEVHGAAWLLHGDLPDDDEWYPGHEIFKCWSLHFFVQYDTRDSMLRADRRISEIRNAYVDEIYGDALIEDYFDIQVDSPDDGLAQWVIARPRRNTEHPLGQRLYASNNRIRDGFVYNLGTPPEQEKTGQDSPAD